MKIKYGRLVDGFVLFPALGFSWKIKNIRSYQIDFMFLFWFINIEL